MPLAIQLTCQSDVPVVLDFGKNEVEHLRFVVADLRAKGEKKQLAIPSLTYSAVATVAPGKPFLKRIDLYSVEPNPLPDTFTVTAELLNGKDGSAIVRSNTVEVSVVRATSEQTEEACIDMAHSIQNSN